MKFTGPQFNKGLAVLDRSLCYTKLLRIQAEHHSHELRPLIIGPVFTREAVTAPRRPRFYLSRAVYVAALLLVMVTAWLVLAGTQMVRNVGDLARFGSQVFQILAPLQLALTTFFAALASASAVALEKDRRTLVLLLLTHLTNSELVLGKLLASLLQVLVMIAAALPLFMLLLLFGGVSPAQIFSVEAVTLATALVAGSLGSTIALWREKTFQSLALVTLAVVLWFTVGEIVAGGALFSHWGDVPASTLAATVSPWRALYEATLPRFGGGWLGERDNPVLWFLAFTSLTAVLLNVVAMLGVRRWNPSRETRPQDDEQRAAHAIATEASTAPVMSAPSRPVWDNPILWREIATRAYGRRQLIIRLAYLLLFGLAAAALVQQGQNVSSTDRAALAAPLVPLLVLSLVLVNAQAVTSLTSERDAKALDLLLVTDLTPKEFVFGKLAGVFYNTKEMLLLPLALCLYLGWTGALQAENLLYLVVGLLIVYGFVAVLGIHSGMTYANSRTAIATSLGTVFFLFLGIATCMRMLVAFSGSFQVQLQPFLAFMVGGGIGLYVALGARNPSPAIGVASLICPIATFYAMTSFLLNYTLGVFLVVAFTYGFATAAMLVPAIYEFDVATGRTGGGEED
jgi:ABC-type transport system involved in multi-copper enzyme maturation permease subunit